MSLPGPAPTLCYESSTVRCVWWRDLCCTVWTTRGTVADLRALGAAQIAECRKMPHREYVDVTVVKPGVAAAMDDATRAEVKAVRDAIGDRQKAQALALLAEGMSAAIVRGVVAGMLLLSKSRVKHKVFDAVDPAVTWSAGFLDPIEGRPVSADHVAEVMRRVLA